MKEIEKIEEKIKDILYNSRISGHELSKSTGINKSMISRYRNGKYKLENMTLSTAKKILDYKWQIFSIKNVKSIDSHILLW